MLTDTATNQDPAVGRTIQMPLSVYEQIRKIAEERRKSFNWTAVQLLIAALEEDKKGEFGA